MESIKAPMEPEDKKNLILYMFVEIGHARLGDRIIINPDPNIWDSVNALKQYLWKAWEMELSKKGYTRQKFLHLMNYRSDDLLLWAYDRIPWKEFVDRIIDSIDGSMGRDIVEGTGKY